MSFRNLVQQVLRKKAQRPSQKNQGRRPKIRLCSLEDRLAPAVGNFQFVTSTSSVAEGTASTTLSVVLRTDNSNLIGNVSVDVVALGTGSATGGGVDYTYSSPQTLSFNSGDSFTLVSGQREYTKTVTVNSIIDDQRVEGTETANFELQNVSSPSDGVTIGSTKDQTLSITDNDTAALSISGSTNITEDPAGTPAANVPVTLTLSTTGTGTVGLDVPVTVDLTGPSLGTDYTLPGSPMATFATGDFTSTSQNVVVTSSNDTIVEGPESFALTLTNVSGPTGTTTSGSNTVNIADNDTAVLSIPNGTTTLSLTEGGSTGSVPVTLTITGNGVSGSGTLGVAVTADLTGTAQSDFTTAPATFAVGAASGSANIVVTATNDTLVEGPESFTGYTLTVSPPLDNIPPDRISVDPTSGDVTVNIADNDTASITFAAGAASATEGGAGASVSAVLTVTANGVSGTGTLGAPVTIDLASTGVASPPPLALVGTDYTLPTSPAFTFAAGAATGNTQTASVAAVNDTIVEGTETDTLNLTIAGIRRASRFPAARFCP